MFGILKRPPSRLAPRSERLRRGSGVSLPRLVRGGFQPRLAVVWVTALVMGFFANLAGPPLRYRIGEIPDRDLRVRVAFDVVNFPQTEWAREEAGKAGIAPIVEKYPVGLPLVRRGQPITSGQHELLRVEHRHFDHLRSFAEKATRAGGLLLINLLLAIVLTIYVSRFQIALAENLSQVIGICVLLGATLASSLLLNRAPWYASLVPMTLTAMVISLAYNPPFALLTSFSLGLVLSLGLGSGVDQFLILMGAVAPSILLLRHLNTRTRLVQVAAGAGLMCAFMTIATGLISGQSGPFIAAWAGRNAVSCLLAGFILTGLLPVVERGFGVITDVSLQELANSSHPLLQELIRRAPGTYTHSMTVATLAEAAAESIGADALLVRVGSYFHDIGKMLKPHYFIENQSGENRHDLLEPSLSTLVIIAHVKDGKVLADQYRLPRPITDLIQQHHGTTRVEYFYREAIRLYPGPTAQALETHFRYPGPRPRSREAAILMLSDAAESASRSLGQPSPASISKLVHDLMMNRLMDHQFDECPLTFNDLRRIEASLAKSLIALFHARIRYPEESRVPAPRRLAGEQ